MVINNRYKELIRKNRAALVNFLKKHWLLTIIVIVAVFGIYFYFNSIYRRIPRYFKKMDPLIKGLDLHPITSCPKLIENGYKLCDFYVASAFRCYLPCTQYYDYSSTEMIKRCLISGARYLELDIFNKGFCYETIPLVCMGKEQGNWHYTTELTFDDCCNMIASYAFSGLVRNSSDPFFLCLNLHVGNNTRTMDKVSDILHNYFNNHLLDQSYSYQRTNLAQVKIGDLINKLVIFSNCRCKDSRLNELINYTWKQPFMRSYSHYEIIDLYEPKEVTDYNRLSLTRVHPGFTDRETTNYNPRVAWMYGCQFVSMNYSSPDENMIIYMKKFRKSSLVLKPYKLRFHPKFYKSPTPQTKKVSFAPEQHSTPNYSITY